MPDWRKLHVKVTESLDVNDMPDDFHRLLWMLLPLIVCREGRGIDNASWVRSRAMPLRDDVTIERVDAAMQWYADREMIRRYVVDGRGYFQIIKFGQYQSTAREAESDYPSPDDEDDACDAAQEQVASNSGVTQEQVASNSGATPALDVDKDKDLDLDTDGEIASEYSKTDDRHARPDTRRRAPRTPSRKSPGDKAGLGDGEAGGAKTDTKKRRKSSGVPPGVAEFRRQAHRYPAKSWYADIEEIVGGDVADLARWGRVVHTWVGKGWNPGNVAGMLELFERGGAFGGSGDAGDQGDNDADGTGGGSGGASADVDAWFAEAGAGAG